MPNLWDGYEGAQPVPADPNLWPGGVPRPPPAPAVAPGLWPAATRQQELQDLSRYMTGSVPEAAFVRDRSAKDAWKQYDDAQFAKQIAPDTGMAFGTATQQEAPYTEREAAEGFRNWYVPEAPWSAGLTVAGASALSKMHPLLKGLALATGFGLTSSEAQAGPRGKGLIETVQGFRSSPKSDKLLYGGTHGPDAPMGNWIVRYNEKGKPNLFDAAEGAPGAGFTDSKTGIPIDEYSFKIANQPKLERNVWDIADREGDTMLFGVKDRTRAGGELTQVGDQKLRRPVPLEGGADYPLLHADQPVPGAEGAQRLFANQQGPVSKVLREAQEIADKGGTPLFTSMVMGKKAGDSSRQVANTAYRLSKQARPDEATIEIIDRSMAAEMKPLKGQPITPYPGFASPDLEKWLDSVSGNYRSAFVRSLDRTKLREGGIPDIGQVRYANTDPRLLNTPTGSSGLLMGEISPELGMVDALHSNYPKAFLAPQGEVAGLAGSVPFKTLAPDLWRGLMKAGKPQYFADNPMTYMMGEMPAGLGKAQKITPEVVDNVSEFFRRSPKGWAVPGAVGLGAGAAALAPGDEAQAGPMDIIRKGIKAYHGSPHDFDKFDISRMGTGEGEQAYGRGLYFAGNEGTARHYRDVLSDPNTKYMGNVKDTANKMSAFVKDPRHVDQLLTLAYEGGYTPGGKESIKQFIGSMEDTKHLMPYLENSSVRKLLDQYTAKPTGRMYEVNINARPDQMLTLDSPMSKQSDTVRSAIGGGAKQRGRFTSVGDSIVEYSDRGDVLGQITKQHDTGKWKVATGYGGGHWKEYPTKDEAIEAMNKHFSAAPLTGEQAYHNVVKRFKGDEENAAKFLADRDVLGLQYLDELSRGAGIKKPTYNYVIPNPDIVSILKKYSIAGGGAGLAPALFDQNQAQAAPDMWKR